MSRRRYRVGINPHYDKRFDILKGRSSILGSGLRSTFDFTKIQMTGSIRNLKSYIADYQSLIKRKEEVLEAIGTDWQNGFRRVGKSIPAEPPEDVLRRQYEAQAELDIIGEELDWLIKELAKMEAKAKTEDDQKILHYGPQGTGKGEPLREIDGQKVEERDGELVIADDRSPYNGLLVRIYREKVVAPYLQNHDRTRPIERQNLPPRPEGV